MTYCSCLSTANDAFNERTLYIYICVSSLVFSLYVITCISFRVYVNMFLKTIRNITPPHLVEHVT